MIDHLMIADGWFLFFFPVFSLSFLFFILKVLVIGGGDGGVLREVVKHDCIESVTLVEIDEAVPRVSKQYLPKMAAGFSHPKVKVIIGDGFEYLKNNEASYDVIITDSSDPVGPAESLFQNSFYDLMKKALKPGGNICTQGLFLQHIILFPFYYYLHYNFICITDILMKWMKN